MAAAEEEIAAVHDAVAAVLTREFGAPEPVALDPYATADDIGEPLSALAQVSSEVRFWRAAGDGRRIGLAVGQVDPEWPVCLFGVAVRRGEPGRPSDRVRYVSSR